MDRPPRIAVTLGDPAGIGPEVIVKAAELSTTPFVVIGDAALLQSAASQWAPALKVRAVSDIQGTGWDTGTLDVLDLGNVPADLPENRASAAGGQAAYDYIERAVKLALQQKVDAITTAPISKEALHLAGHEFPGHTELLAQLTGTEHVALMMAADTLRVVLTTTHVSLADVGPLITQERVHRTLQLTHRWLQMTGLPEPRLQVTGLNPHCGDGGIFGDAETRAILPAIEQAQREGIQVSGPFSADALFGRFSKNPCDAVVTMFHDQGMIPIKMAAQDRAVNVTLGLPIIRTSVDHGTAYDIAGQGKASPDSMLAALALASTLARNTCAVR